MQVYVVRHGSAASKSSWKGDDGARPLTSTGRARFTSAAKSLVAASALAPQLVISSPLVRAHQTADLLCHQLGSAAKLKIDARLGHEFDLSALRDIIAEQPDLDRVAVVGHNPSLTMVLCGLLGNADVELRKGAIAAIEITDAEAPAGRLLWLAPTQLFPVPE